MERARDSCCAFVPKETTKSSRVKASAAASEFADISPGKASAAPNALIPKT